MRIEDTDLERSNQASVDVILEGMAWLGMNPDEGPFYQMQRMDRYKEVLAKLQTTGQVYPCYMSIEDLMPCVKNKWQPKKSRAMTALGDLSLANHCRPFQKA